MLKLQTQEEALQKGDFEFIELENVYISENDLFKMKKSEFEDKKAYVMVDENTNMLDYAVTYRNNVFTLIPSVTCLQSDWDDVTHINYFYRAVIEGVKKDNLLTNCGIVYHEDELHDPLAISYTTKYEMLRQRCKQIHHRLRKVIDTIYIKGPKKLITSKVLLDPNPLHILEKIVI